MSIMIMAVLQLSLAIPAQAVSEPEPLVFGLFIGSIEEGARIFTPVRLLPFEHPDAHAHEFPNALVNYTSEVDALVHLGRQSDLRLRTTLMRYPRPPVSEWPYPEFARPPLGCIRGAAVERAASEAALPGLRGLVVSDGRPLVFIVDTRRLTLEERGMERATSMGLDLTRAEFLEGLNTSVPTDVGDGCRIITYPGPWSELPTPAGTGEGQSSESEEGVVLEVVRSFKQSLRAGDAEGVLDVLHPDVRIYEGGHAETREDYSQGHLQADMEFLQAVETTVISEQAVVHGELAFYLSEWTGKGEFRGRPVDLHGTETLILVRTPAGWRIRHVHWSSR